ncbi:ribonuclease inhibitor [Algoriphagus jejuensis]|uniref:Ribonuclease inhibitor n=2 Tax=Algoriphagus jejuensis TaxID=419934 RepID=A0ABP3YKY6_9BACT
MIAVFLKVYIVLVKKAVLQEAVNFCLFLGAVSAAIAALLGFLLSQSGGYEGELLDVHLTAGWITVAMSWTAWWVNKNEGKFSKKLNYILLGVLMITLSVAGHFGGSLTHGEDYLTAYAPFGNNQKANRQRLLANAEEAEVFTDVIQPILKSKCQSCHRAGKMKGELDMTSFESLMVGGENGPVLIPADTENSELIRRVKLPSDHDDFMPAEGKKPLTEEEIQWISWWIEKGNADPKVLLMQADEELIAWAEPRLNIMGAEKSAVSNIDTAQIQGLERVGFRVRVLSQESAALDIVLPAESAGGQASELVKALLPVKDQVYWLTLAGVGIQDSDLTLISQFKNLQRLRLENNPITDRGISSLKSLTNLEVLNLNGTKISGAGLGPIAEIKTLRSLYLWNTSVNSQEDWVKKMSSAVKVVFGE